jgi:RNA polymerase sigma factor (sigma-70 family)
MTTDYYKPAKSAARRIRRTFNNIPYRDSEDLTQECALAAWKEHHRYDPTKARLSSYLWVCAWSQGRRFAITQGRKKRTCISYVDPQKMDRVSGSWDSHSKEINLYDLILPTKLGEKDRFVWRAWLDHDLNLVKTAPVLGVSHQAVGYRIQKIIAHLKKFYNKPITM